MIDECDLLLEKARFGAFHGTELERLLRPRGIDSVMLTVDEMIDMIGHATSPVAVRGCET